MATRLVAVRVAESLETQARGAHPELAGLDVSRLIRVGLAVLAGHRVPEAIEISAPAKPWNETKPKAGAAA